MTRPAWLPPWHDLLLAGGFVVLVGAEAVLGSSQRPPLVHAAIGVPAMLALAWRGWAPVLVAAMVSAANFALNDDGQSTTILAVPFAFYSIGRMPDRRRSLVGLAVFLVIFVGSFVWTGSFVPSDAAAAVVFIAGPWAVGALVRSREETTRGAVARAALLEREKQLEGELAASRERVRLARELHDVVSHSISVIAVQAQAVRRRLPPDQQREADDLRAVEVTAREAMAELRRLFGVLRSDEPALSLAPQPGLGELDRLVEQVRGTGLDVRLLREGEAAPLQPGVDLAAYRIVQEALTNVIKHARAAAVAITIDQRPDALDLSIEDDGHGLNGTLGNGHGLTGIRERAELYGGTLDVGTSSSGGVRVHARLPLTEVPAC